MFEVVIFSLFMKANTLVILDQTFNHFSNHKQ